MGRELNPTGSGRAISVADHSALRAWLLDTLGGLAPGFTDQIGDETSLAEGGLSLDSVALIELVAAFEEGLAVTIRENDITSENFATVERLLSFLERRRG